MAKVRIKLGVNEIEIDSRDFYIDNVSARNVIAEIAQLLQYNLSRLADAPNAKDSRIPSKQAALVEYEDDSNTAVMADVTGSVHRIDYVHSPATDPPSPTTNPVNPDSLEPDCLGSMMNAEVDDPPPASAHIKPHEIKHKIHILAKDSFFASPRTVSETVDKLRQHGWTADSLDVSKTLAGMVTSGELHRASQNDRNHYSALLVAGR